MSFRDNAEIIEDMIALQLDDGKRGDGESLPDYSPVSVQVYGKPEGAIKLYDQGDFYRGIRLTVGTSAAEIAGTDSKTAELELMYGEEITQLSDENKEELKDSYLRDDILRSIKKELL